MRARYRPGASSTITIPNIPNSRVEVAAVTPESQRIAIATACGWKRSTNYCSDGTQVGHYWLSKDGESNNDIPDYLSDLNACAEFEKTLTGSQRNDYYSALYDMQTSRFVSDVMFHAMCATAPQRCEAFLRTLSLWIDDK